MEVGENMSLAKEELKCCASSENSKIAEILELCFEPESKEELDNILLNFWKKINYSRVNEYFCRFDDISMYALDYIYKHDTASFSSVSKSLFLYQMQYQLVLKGKDRNAVLYCDNDCVLKKLRQFKNLHTYSKTEDMLVDVGLGSILAGNVGLARFLVKFGLIEFPSEANQKCKKMFEILVSMFNSCSQTLTANVQADNMQTSILLDQLLNKVKETENIRRSILIFCILVVVAEYQMYEKIGEDLSNLKFYTEHKKDLCLQKLKCVDLFIQASMETVITFKDIKSFTEVFLSTFLTAEVCQSLVETCMKILGKEHNFYKPRSLKDLARFKVRSSFRNTMSIAEQVNELRIPVALKKFLNFHIEGVWKLLVINHLNLSFEQSINRRLPEIEDENGQAIQNRNEREVEEGNEREVEEGNEREVEEGNVRELEDGNVRNLEDANTEDGKLQELDDGNL